MRKHFLSPTCRAGGQNRKTLEKSVTMRRRICALLCVLLLLTVPVGAAEEGVRIAFLDSGISLKHLDPAQVEAGENLIFPGRDTDDRVGHGTATAGLVLGAADMGLTGLCPSATAVPIVCYDRYPSGAAAQGDSAVLARAIRLAVDRYNCRIVNISMGTTEDSQELRAAVEYAQCRGALVISAVGNDNRTDPERVYYPAAYDGVIGVGAADGEGAAPFSQRHGVDVLAPGTNLATASNRNSAQPELRSGTSYACAVVSGICARIWTEEPELTADEVKQRLFDMARDVEEPGFDGDSGWGIVEPLRDAPQRTGAYPVVRGAVSVALMTALLSLR